MAAHDSFGSTGPHTRTIQVDQKKSTPSSGLGKGPDAFVTALYNEVLGRAPEPAGLFFWSKQLALKVKPRTVATSFWNSRGNERLRGYPRRGNVIAASHCRKASCAKRTHI